MGIFNSKPKQEKTYEENGFLIGIESHTIYHVPLGMTEYILPNSAISISESAIIEMGRTAITIIVPESFKIFKGDFSMSKSLKNIVLKEGVVEIKCITKQDVDFQLPTTIKKIGKNNYPIVKDLVIPSGVTELDDMFASHDTNLISVQVPGSIKKVPTYAFNQCRNLQRVHFDEGVESCEANCFRGTNCLKSLFIPRTFNGRFDLSMEQRPCSNLRGNSSYDARNFEQESKEMIEISVARNESVFKFLIRRGDNPSISINNNIINIQSTNQPVISIDCNKIPVSTYVIKEGKIISQVQTQSKEIDEPDNSINKENNYQNQIIKQIEILLSCEITPYSIEDSDNGRLKNTLELMQEQGQITEMINQCYNDGIIDSKTRSLMILTLISEYKKMKENAPRPVLQELKTDQNNETVNKSI